MEKPTSNSSNNNNQAALGPKVSQIANIFQRRPIEPPPEIPIVKENPSPGSAVVRTESHAARFNHARALFERLGEGKVNVQSTGFSIKHSNSKEDNLKDIGSDDARSPSPKIKYVKITNGVSKIDTSKIHNISRIKMPEKTEKPDKPEKKFNSRELIEKQKNWTSHFSKTKTNATKYHCDIIRPMAGATQKPKYSENETSSPPHVLHEGRKPTMQQSPIHSNSYDESMSLNDKPLPPIIAKKPQVVMSPTRSPVKRQTTDPLPERPDYQPVPPHRRDSLGVQSQNSENERKSSLSDDYVKIIQVKPQQHQPSNQELVRRYSSTSDKEPISPGNPISSSPSPGVSVASDPTSPVHTEDEKQENEETEKHDQYFDEFNKREDGEYNTFLHYISTKYLKFKQAT